MVMSAAATSESNSVADFANTHNENSEDKPETDVPFNNNNNNTSANILNEDDDESQSDCDTRSPSNLVINYVDFSEAESEGGEEENRRKNICRNIEYLDTQYKGKLNWVLFIGMKGRAKQPCKGSDNNYALITSRGYNITFVQETITSVVTRHWTP